MNKIANNERGHFDQNPYRNLLCHLFLHVCKIKIPRVHSCVMRVPHCLIRSPSQNSTLCISPYITSDNIISQGHFTRGKPGAPISVAGVNKYFILASTCSNKTATLDTSTGFISARECSLQTCTRDYKRSDSKHGEHLEKCLLRLWIGQRSILQDPSLTPGLDAPVHQS